MVRCLCLGARGSRRLLAALVIASGCSAPRAVPDAPSSAGPPQAAPLPATVTFQADVAPIRALAISADSLWVGSDRGLRRMRLPAGPTAWIGAASGMTGRRVSALAADRAGGVLVGTDAEVGRLFDDGGHVRYQTVAKLPDVTHLATAVAPAAVDGVWAGTTTGLFFLTGGRASPIAGASGVGVVSLDVEADGRSAWAGLAGQGLVQVDGRQVVAAFGPRAAEPLDFVDTLGTALLENGTRVALGRSAAGGRARILVLRRSGPEFLMADPEIAVQALIAAPAGSAGTPFMLAGLPGTPQLYRVQIAERGQVSGPGAIRFSPARKNLQSLRLVALPTALAVPPAPTTALAAPGAGADDAANLFVGTRSLGVARPAEGAPAYLPVGELALNARGISVACMQPQRCVFATGAGPGWTWDGGAQIIKPLPDGAVGGDLMAVAGDGRGTVYSIASGQKKALQISRLAGDGAAWEPVMSLTVQVEGAPVVAFATMSPLGNIWMSLRDRASSGQESGRGAIELQLPAGRAIQHRPYRAGEPRPAEAIPVAGAVNAIRFQKPAGPGDPQAVWFCTSLGVLRFAGGQLSDWGENDGLDSETCNDLEFAPDGTVWAATQAGVVRFDGKGWRRSDSRPTVKGGGNPRAPRWPVSRDEGVAARALAISGQTLWAATSRGLWPIGADAAAAPIDRTAGLADEDVVDLTSDRFGRLWVLGRVGLTVRRPQIP